MITWLIKFGIVMALGLAGIDAIKRPRLLLLHLIIFFWLLVEIVCQIP